MTPNLRAELLDAIFEDGGDGPMKADLQHRVEDAIKRYPDFQAEWWLGGVAAVLALLDGIGVDRGTE